jgi:hypothetical protein
VFCNFRRRVVDELLRLFQFACGDGRAHESDIGLDVLRILREDVRIDRLRGLKITVRDFLRCAFQRFGNIDCVRRICLASCTSLSTNALIWLSGTAP